MRKLLGGMFLAMMVIGLISGPAAAQSTGTVKGVVKDATGAILPGASVILTNKATQRVQTALTTETGNYVFSAVSISLRSTCRVLKDSCVRA